MPPQRAISPSAASRGHGGLAGLLLGPSISQQCAHHASCPVLSSLFAPLSDIGQRVDVHRCGTAPARSGGRCGRDDRNHRDLAAGAVSGGRPPTVRSAHPAAPRSRAAEARRRSSTLPPPPSCARVSRTRATAGFSHVVIDLRGLVFMDCAGLRLLLVLSEVAHAAGAGDCRLSMLPMRYAGDVRTPPPPQCSMCSRSCLPQRFRGRGPLCSAAGGRIDARGQD